MNTEPELNLFPETSIQAAYDQAEFALTDLPLIYENFSPVIENPNNPKEAQTWEASTHLAWALRMADSQNNQEEIKKIQERIKINLAFEYYVAYQFLTDSYETETEIGQQGYGLNPVTQELKSYLTDIFKNRLTSTTEPKDLLMFKNVASRVEYGGETYFDAKTITEISPKTTLL